MPIINVTTPSSPNVIISSGNNSVSVTLQKFETTVNFPLQKTQSDTYYYPLTSNPNSYLTPSNTGIFLDSGLAAILYYSNNNPSGFTTSGYITNYYVAKTATGVFVYTGSTGNFITTSQTGVFASSSWVTANYYSISNPNNYVSSGNTGNFIDIYHTGKFLDTGVASNLYYLLTNPSGFITTGQTGVFVFSGNTGNFATTGWVDINYYPRNNPSGYVLSGNTGIFITTGQTGLFYPASNPSGYSSASNFATTGWVNSGYAPMGTVTRTLPTGIGQTIEIGSFINDSNGTHNIGLAISCNTNPYDSTKFYNLTTNYNTAYLAWNEVVPMTSSNPGTLSDFTLDLYQYQKTLSLRLRRTTGTYTGICSIKYINYNSPASYFTESSGTDSISSPLSYISFDRNPSGYIPYINPIRTIPTGINQYVELGTFTNTSNGVHNLLMSVSASGYNFGTTKTYNILSKYSLGVSGWFEVYPIFDTGPINSNNFALDTFFYQNYISFRLRRTTGTNAGIFDTRIINFNPINDLFVASTATGYDTVGTQMSFYGVTASIGYTKPNSAIGYLNFQNGLLISYS